MPQYFHVGSPSLSIGQVISPGRWGEALRKFRDGGPSIDNHGTAVAFAWEVTLEAARRFKRPLAPSRMECVFLTPTRLDAVRFRDKYRKGASIWAVETEAPAELYVGDFELLLTGSDPIADAMVANSISYWSGQEPKTPEILWGGPVRIVSPAY